MLVLDYLPLWKISGLLLQGNLVNTIASHGELHLRQKVGK